MQKLSAVMLAWRRTGYEDHGVGDIDRDLEVRPAPLMAVEALYTLDGGTVRTDHPGNISLCPLHAITGLPV